MAQIIKGGKHSLLSHLGAGLEGQTLASTVIYYIFNIALLVPAGLILSIFFHGVTLTFVLTPVIVCLVLVERGILFWRLRLDRNADVESDLSRSSQTTSRDDKNMKDTTSDNSEKSVTFSTSIVLAPVDFGPVEVYAEGRRFRFTSAQEVVPQYVLYKNNNPTPLNMDILRYNSWLICTFVRIDNSSTQTLGTKVTLSPGESISLKISLHDVPLPRYTLEQMKGSVSILGGNIRYRMPVTCVPRYATQVGSVASTSVPTLSVPPAPNPAMPPGQPTVMLGSVKLTHQTALRANLALVLVLFIGAFSLLPLSPFKKGGYLTIERSIIQNPIVLDSHSLSIVGEKIPLNITAFLQKDRLFEGFESVLAGADSTSANNLLRTQAEKDQEVGIRSFIKQARADWDHLPADINLDQYVLKYTQRSRIGLHNARINAILGFLATKCAENSTDTKKRNDRYRQATAYWEEASHDEADVYREGMYERPKAHHQDLEARLHPWLAAIYLVQDPPNYSKTESELRKCQYTLEKNFPGRSLSPEIVASLASLEYYLRGDPLLFRQLLERTNAKTLRDLKLPSLITLDKTRFDFDTPHVSVQFDDKRIPDKDHEIFVTEEDLLRALNTNDNAFGMVLTVNDQQSKPGIGAQPFALFKASTPTSESMDEPLTWANSVRSDGIYLLGKINVPANRRGSPIYRNYQASYTASIANDASLKGTPNPFQQGELTLRWQTSRPRVIDLELVLPSDLYPLEYASPDNSNIGDRSTSFSATLISRSKTKSKVEFVITPTLSGSKQATGLQYWAQVKLYCEKSNTLLGRLGLLVFGDLLFTIATFFVLATMTKINVTSTWDKVVCVILPLAIFGLAMEFFWKCSQRSAADLFVGAVPLLVFSCLLFLFHTQLLKLAKNSATASNTWQLRRSTLCLLLCLVHAFVASHLMHQCVPGQAAFGPLALTVSFMVFVMMTSILTLKETMGRECFAVFSITMLMFFVGLVGKTWNDIPALGPVPFLGGPRINISLIYFIGLPVICFIVASFTKVGIMATPYLQPFFDFVSFYKKHTSDPIFWLMVLAASLAAMQTYTQVVSLTR